MASKAYKLTYFPLTGRAEPIRLAFYIGNIDFEDERIYGEKYVEKKPTLPYEQMPVLQIDDEIYAQSLALLRYAGKITNLYPKDPLQALFVDEIIDALQDITQVTFQLFKESDPEKKAALGKSLSENELPKMFGKLNKRLETKGTSTYTVADLSIADLSIYNSVNLLRSGKVEGISKDVAEKYPKIIAIRDLVANHPRVKEWEANHP